ncbi:HPr kinase/phosphorylase [Martelella soudanensis]|uniref:HPr kinase/phosphorylase n=1 Tax=unclassified Martelella TaxID=2629616 RepID=UPI0015DE5B24|nr:MULTISPECIES: HPr kinase/phosphorylase [unclassified Martelella]
MTGATNLHATAIVLGATGILITGPSGAGKSALALSLIRAGRLHGLHASLIADDQIMISAFNGTVVAAAPAATAGLIEIRGTGLVPIDHLPEAVIDFALLPVDPAEAARLPEAGESLAVLPGLALPLARLHWPSPDPFSTLAALCPGLEEGRPARPRFADY